MRRTIPGRYFIALAFADNLVLLGEFIKWLNTRDPHRGPKLGLQFHHSNQLLCQSVTFLRYGAKMWSSWLTIGITIERFLTVTFPFKIANISSPMKAVVVILAEAVVCFSLACFPFFTLKVRIYGESWLCAISSESYHTYHTWVMVAVAGVGELVLPSIIVSIFTVLIIVKLVEAQRNRGRLSMSEMRVRGRQRQPTIALVVIAATFVTVRMPYLIMFFVNDLSKTFSPHISSAAQYNIYIAYTISEVFAVLNYAVNFFIFCVSGNTFRAEFAKCYMWNTVHERRGSGINMTERTDLRKMSTTSNFSKSLRRAVRGTILGDNMRESNASPHRKGTQLKHESVCELDSLKNGQTFALLERGPSAADSKCSPLGGNPVLEGSGHTQCQDENTSR